MPNLFLYLVESKFKKTYSRVSDRKENLFPSLDSKLEIIIKCCQKKNVSQTFASVNEP